MSEPAPISGPQRVAVVIAAQDDRDTISSTVRACNAIPGVDLIVVVDDGSTDDTATAARSAGAVVVRHSVPRGRASALETGVKVVAMRDREDWPSRHLLFLDPTLGDSAVEASALVEPLNRGAADCAIGVAPAEGLFVRRSGAQKAAYATIRGITGFSSTDSLASNRALTREAVNTIMPFSAGHGVDVGMTVDLLTEGFSVVEIPCEFEAAPRVRTRKRDGHGTPSRGDIWWTVRARRILSRRVKPSHRLERDQQGVGIPYSLQLPKKSASGS